MSGDKIALQTRGHSDEHGGLRGHSIGPSYPFSVICIWGDGNWRSNWHVVHYLNGKLYSGPLDCGTAHDLALLCKAASDAGVPPLPVE